MGTPDDRALVGDFGSGRAWSDDLMRQSRSFTGDYIHFVTINNNAATGKIL